ncbi:hypothetical protein ACFYXF_43005 [Streptomyces sp. NPDC002680]|uniref:hypothetical protein n=1 Tax=Streptomyces sp. NPDC002680 TaxID=3364659 RepID=UPI00369670C3
MSITRSEGARPYDPIRDLSPRAIEDFLRTVGWIREGYREGINSFWVNEAEGASLMLPYNSRFRDFTTRLNDALRTISEVHKVKGEALALEIASARSDILLLRADQATFDGSIPLAEAQSLINGASQMILAAACSAINPRATHPSRKPDAAKDFLAEEVRMGHTLRGSFVITILARHESTVREELPEPLLGRESPSADEADIRASEAPQGVIESYTRRVMSTLASGLQAANELLQDEPQITESEAVEQGASAQLMESIGRMGSWEGINSLDMSFRWSPSHPTPPAETPSRVVLPREQAERASFVGKNLRRQPNILHESVIGYVIRLERAEGKDDGIAVIDGVLGKSRRRVRVQLSGDHYRLAIRAHDQRAPVVAVGTVTLERRAWWINRAEDFRLALQ